MPHLAPYLQPCIFWYANVAFTIFDQRFTPYLLYFLRHSYKEQICEIPFFCPVNVIFYSPNVFSFSFIS